MKLKRLPFIIFLFIILISACGDSDEIDPGVSEADQALTRAVEIANQGMTQTASAINLAPSATQGPPTPTVTLIYPTSNVPTDENTSPTSDNGETSDGQTPAATQGSIATSAPFSSPTTAASGGIPCLRASFEDETIPDGTRLPREKDFEKNWRLKNSGSCTWTGGFDIIFVEGDILNASSAVALTSIDIPPGGYVDAIVNMQSPLQTGTYTGYWMLRSSDGLIFGVGINANEWFWVTIVSFDPAAIP